MWRGRPPTNTLFLSCSGVSPESVSVLMRVCWPPGAAVVAFGSLKEQHGSFGDEKR